MKKIEAVIRPEKLNEVRMALEKAGYPGIMISEIEGHGKQKGVTLQWRGEQYKVDLLPKIKIEIVAKDNDTEKIMKTLIDSARVGETGDGKIFVSPIEEVVRIRTGEKGDVAL
ncbi:MAG TPA: P-II family nitrogen regulator [Elusimicrobia bacterium]|jgi:nitrogen regulatory protein PII|nr:P-II family nitrogen regulator [Elusimicrobiota bacterium]